MTKLMIPLLLFVSATLLSAESFFTLRGVERVYPVVEIGGTKVPKSQKAYVKEALMSAMQELGIKSDGDSRRSLAILVGESYTTKTPVISVRLLIGEQVRRTDSPEKVFGITYQNASAFAYDPDTVEENLEDVVDDLLAKFADQYREEQRAIRRVGNDDGDFASALSYETDYAAAIDKAKKKHKNVMLVLVTNYCPWCRKFEEQVLRKEDVNTLVHEKYVPVILNKQKDAFPSELDMFFTPIVHFIDPLTGKSYHQSVGYNEREMFTHWLQTDK